MQPDYRLAVDRPWTDMIRYHLLLAALWLLLIVSTALSFASRVSRTQGNWNHAGSACLCCHASQPLTATSLDPPLRNVCAAAPGAPRRVLECIWL